MEQINTKSWLETINDKKGPRRYVNEHDCLKQNNYTISSRQNWFVEWVEGQVIMQLLKQLPPETPKEQLRTQPWMKKKKIIIRSSEEWESESGSECLFFLGHWVKPYCVMLRLSLQGHAEPLALIFLSILN